MVNIVVLKAFEIDSWKSKCFGKKQNSQKKKLSTYFREEAREVGRFGICVGVGNIYPLTDLGEGN